jgi:hypothetical protein
VAVFFNLKKSAADAAAARLKNIKASANVRMVRALLSQ